MNARHLERGHYVRDEPGHLANGNAAYLHLTGRDDESAGFVGYPVGRDGRCDWCYLGAPHTIDAHNAKMAAER